MVRSSRKTGNSVATVLARDTVWQVATWRFTAESTDLKEAQRWIRKVHANIHDMDTAGQGGQLECQNHSSKSEQLISFINYLFFIGCHSVDDCVCVCVFVWISRPTSHSRDLC